MKWINDLKGVTYPTSVPVDQGKHWANPTGICDGKVTPPDCDGSPNAGPYVGSVPIAVHLHGSHTWSNSDGIPESWFLPAGAPEPFPRGSDWSQTCQPPMQAGQQCTAAVPIEDGAAVFDYPNNQPATLLFWWGLIC